MSRITCKEFEILLADYLDGTLAAEEKAAVEEHRNCLRVLRGTGAGCLRRARIHRAGSQRGSAAGAGEPDFV